MKNIKRIILTLIVCTISSITFISPNIVQAAPSLFTLDPIPTPDHEVVPTKVANVATALELKTALADQSINTINLTSNITYTSTNNGIGNTINRDLLVNGNNYTLTIIGNTNYSTNWITNNAINMSGSAYNLGTNGYSGTFHLKDINIARSTIGDSENTLISVHRNTTNKWDIILENFKTTDPTNKITTWFTMVDGPRNASSKVNVFLRGTSRISATKYGYLQSSGSTIFEENSNITLVNDSTGALSAVPGTSTNVYFGKNAKVDIASGTTNLTPNFESNIGNGGIFREVFNINLYSGSIVKLRTGSSATQYPIIWNINTLTSMNIKIDSNAELNITGDRNGSVITSDNTAHNTDNGDYHLIIEGNPGSKLFVVSTNTNNNKPAIELGTENSYLSLNNPADFNIENRGNNIAISGSNPNAPFLYLNNTNIGIWQSNSSTTGNPVAPSPFTNVNLIATIDGLGTGSSPVIDTIPNGWDHNNINRLAYTKNVIILADDIVMPVSTTEPIIYTVNPTNANLSYTSTDPSIATVDSNGKVTSITKGVTTITIRGSAPNILEGMTTITVTVTNDLPTIDVPPFSEVPVGNTFNPLTNVIANDLEDGDISKKILITNPIDTNVPGLYTVQYKVSDSNNNTVTAQQIVVVSSSNIIVGESTIIEAYDFTKYVKQVDLNNLEIISSAQVKVYDKTTGNLISNDHLVVNINQYSKIPAIYPITFSVSNDPNTSITINATVIGGEAPVITIANGYQPLLIKVGTNFNPFDNVTINDLEDDRDGLKVVSWSNPTTIDTNIAGIYQIELHAQDSDLNISHIKRTLIVDDGSFVLGDNYIIRAYDFTINISQVSNNEISIKQLSLVKVYDLNGNLVNMPLNINQSTYGKILGDHNITFTINGETITKKIIATVSDGNDPTLSVTPFIELNVNALFNPKDYIINATDIEDGPLKDIVTNDSSSSLDSSIPGLYRINYTVIDSDNNLVSAALIVLINDGSFVVGDKFIISATDYIIRTGQVNLDHSSIEWSANVTTYSKSTGLEVLEPITITNLGGYAALPDLYPITFAIDSDPKATLSINAQVISGDSPKITLTSPTVIQVNDSFDLLTGVSALDTEDGILSPKIVINPISIDTTKAGVYNITYTVTDSDNNLSTINRVVVVQDDSVTVGTNYVIIAHDFTKRISTVSLIEQDIITDAFGQVYDLMTGNELFNNISIQVNDYTNKVGIYPINFSVRNEPTTTITKLGSVINGHPPQILIGSPLVEIEKGALFNVLDDLMATDLEDGPLTSLVTTNVTEIDTNIPGVYPIIYTIIDSDGNLTTITRVVVVNYNKRFMIGDTHIIDAQDFTIGLGQVDINESIIKDNAQVKSYDRTTGHLSNSNILISNNGGYQAKLGDYNITFTIENELSTTTTIIAHVISRNIPTIKTPSLSIINVGASFNVMDNVSALDLEDGLLTNDIISNTLLIDTNTPGVYPIEYTVIDSDFNEVSAIQVVVVQVNSIVVGKDYIIQAQDFAKLISEVNTASAAIIQAAQVTVYDSHTGAIVPVEISVISDEGYTNSKGIYHIIFGFLDDPTLLITIEAQVLTGSSPTIILPETLSSINIGDTIDLSAGVIVSDNEDGSLIDKLDINPTTIDTNDAGVYQVTYSIIDQDNNKTEVTRVVVVNDGTITVGNKLIIQANHFEKYVSNVIVSDVALLEATLPRVYNLQGVLLTDEIVKITNNGGYNKIANIYNIELSTTSDTTATITVKGSVLAGNAPLITLPNNGAPIEINQGANFAPFDNVIISDIEDDKNDLTLNKWSRPTTIDTTHPGVYVIELSVEDSDNNVTSINRVVVVNNGRYNVSPNYIIEAYDFTINVGQVDQDLSVVKQLAQVKVYDSSGNQVDVPVDVNLGTYDKVINQYPITFTVNGDLASMSIIANVIKGGVPILQVDPFVEVNLFGNFDANLYIKEASDIEDGNLINEVQNDSATEVDISKAGLYLLHYTLSDKDGNKVTAQMVVLVNDGSYVVGNDYIISAQPFTQRIAQVNVNSEAIMGVAKVQVYDKVSGLTVSNQVNLSNDGGYTNAVNNYDITFVVAADSSATITIVGNVISGDDPIITLTNDIEEINISEPFDERKGVNVNDTEDGPLNDSIYITSSTVNTNEAGVYIITYEASDTDGNTTTKSKVVVVNDGTIKIGANLIIKANNFERYVSEVVSSDLGIINATAPIIYNLEGHVVNAEQVIVTNNGGYTNIAATYSIRLSSNTDSSANITITGTVIEGVAPVITLPNGGAPLVISPNTQFNPFDGLRVSDQEDDANGKLIRTWSNPTTINTSIPGVYQIVLFAQDSDNNITQTTRVVVVDDGSFSIGDKYIIQAYDFIINRVNVDQNIAVVKDNAQVKVYDIKGNLDDSLIDVDLGTYDKLIGEYDLTFTVSGTNTTKTVVAQVISGNIPVLEVIPFIETQLNANFNAQTYINEASDVEDGSLINDVKNNSLDLLDTTQAGLYLVTYTLSDKDDNIVTKEIVVLVNDGTYVVGDEYIIRAHDFTLRVGQVNTEPDVIKGNAQVDVYSKFSGQAVSVPVNIKDDGGYTNLIGIYPIIFAINNDSKAQISIKGTVIDGNAPVITITDLLTEIDINENIDLNTGISASDKEDGSLNNKIFVSPLMLDTSKAGVYVVTYNIIDSDGNTTIATKVVVVNDGTIRIGNNLIIQANHFEKYVSSVIVSERALLEATMPRVYNLQGILINDEIVNVTNNGGYNNIKNVYDIELTTTSDKSATITVKGSVLAGTAPVITLPNNGAPIEISSGATFDPFDNVMISDIEDDANNITINRWSSPTTIDTNQPGVYVIELSVEDSDKNVTSITRVVVINDGRYNVGANYIIEAYDFTINVAQVNQDSTVVKELSQVKVYDNTGKQVDVTVDVNLGTYDNVVSQHYITFIVNGDSTSIGIIGHVISSYKPTLEVNPFIEITINDDFKANDYIIKAEDTEDGPLITEVSNNSSSTLNTTKAGIYYVTYTLNDSDNNTVVAKSIVLVNDGTYVVGKDFIIKAQDFTIRVSDVNTTHSALINNASASVYSVETGLPLAEKIQITNDSGYTNKIGNYDITFIGENDNNAMLTIVASVINGSLPIIEIDNNVSEVVINEVFDPKKNIQAYDVEDGDITNNVIVTPNSIDTSIPGIYPIIYSVSDTDGNTVYINKIVVVNDNSYVIGNNYIIKANSFSKYISEVKTTNQAIVDASNTQVYDLQGNLLNATLINIANTSGYTNISGDYLITLALDTDPTCAITITGSVIAGNIPEITLLKGERPIEIASGSHYNIFDGLTISDIEDNKNNRTIKQWSNADNIDLNKEGVYQIEVYAQDSDNNITSKMITLVVNDGHINVGNNYIIQAQDFTINSKDVIKNSELVKNHSQVKVYNIQGQEVDVSLDVELGLYDKYVGNYDINFTVSDDTATMKIIAEVISGHPPTLKVNNLIEININDEFDANRYILEATDLEDGPLINKVENDTNKTLDTTQAGVYIVTYNLNDSSDNSVSAQLIVVVNDGSIKVGSQYIIRANDFTIRSGQVNQALEAILNEALVRVYDKDTGLAIEVPTIITNDSGYSNIVNNYNITFEVIDDATTSITSIAHVITGERPVIILDDSILEIKVGELFNPKHGLSITDLEDGVITDDVKITNGNINTDIAGVYKITYSTIDSDHNTATITRVLIVNDGSITKGDRNILQAYDFELYISDVIVSDESIINNALVKVYDLQGNALTNEQVQVKSSSNYQALPNQYPITITTTTDKSLISNIIGTVLAGNAPKISIPKNIPITTEKGSYYDPFNDVSISDLEDDLKGYKTKRWSNSDTINTDIIGIYQLKLYAQDADNNITSTKRTYIVNDGTYSIGDKYIIEAHDYTINIKDLIINKDSVKTLAQLKVYDLLGNVVDVFVDVNLGFYDKKQGTYDITFTINGENMTRKILATVLDDNTPLLEVDKFIELDLNERYNEQDYILKALDIEDGELTNKVSSNSKSTLKMNIAGLYQIKYSVIDSAQNKVEATMIVLVNDGTYTVSDNGYVIKDNDYTIRVSQVVDSNDAIIKESEITVYSNKTGQIIDASITITDDGGYTSKVGQYIISYFIEETSNQNSKKATSKIQSVIANVIAGDAPIITLPDKFIKTQVGNAFNFKLGVSATDKEDGDLTTQIILTPNMIDTNRAGVYKVIYTVTDSDNNTTSLTRVVAIIDDSIKVGNSLIIQAYDFKIHTKNVNLNEYAIIDNGKVKVYSISTGDEIIDSAIVVKKGDYSRKVGEYKIKYLSPIDSTIEIEIDAVVYDDLITKPNDVLPNTGVNTIMYIYILVVTGMTIIMVNNRIKE